VIVRDRPREEQGPRVIPVLICLDDFRSGGSDEFSGIELKPMPGLRLQADISLFEVLPVLRIPAGSMYDIDCLSEAHIDVKTQRSGHVVDGEHAHVDVRRIGPHVEVAQAVESGHRAVGVPVNVTVEHQAEVGAPLRQGRLRRSRRCRRGALCRRNGRRRRRILAKRRIYPENTRQAYAQIDAAFHFVPSWGRCPELAIRSSASV